MKRWFIFLSVFLMYYSAAYADFSVGTMNNLKDAFEINSSLKSWVHSTSTSRTYFWLMTVKDIKTENDEFEPIDHDKDIPLFIMGLAENYGSLGMYGTVFMYLKDIHDLYRQVIICPERDYLIYEDTGIPYKKAKENLMSRAISCFEMNYDEIINELEILNSNATTKEESTETTEYGQNHSNDKAGEALPTIKGPFAGDTVEVQVNGKRYVVHQEFKKVMDKYQEYFDSYISFVKSLDKKSSDYLTKYAELLEKYVEVSRALEKLKGVDNSSLTKDEENYLIYVVTSINTDLISAMSEL